MDDQHMSDRVKKVLEIAEKIHKTGTVYKRLAPEELTRKRNFAALSAPKPSDRQIDSTDLTRSYGF
jgi:hypothetical protein